MFYIIFLFSLLIISLVIYKNILKNNYLKNQKLIKQLKDHEKYYIECKLKQTNENFEYQIDLIRDIIYFVEKNIYNSNEIFLSGKFIFNKKTKKILNIILKLNFLKQKCKINNLKIVLLL